MAIILQSPVSALAGSSDMIMVRTTSKSIDEVVKAIETYSDKHDWFFLGADKLLGGKITLVKTCIPDVGPLVWSQDMKYTALLPCGNISVYKKGKKTEIAVLSGSYMHALVPTPEMQKASEALIPLLRGLIDEVAQ